MSRTLLLGGESALPTTTGTATSFSEASAVRLVNNSTSAYAVVVVETQGGSVIGSMTMPGNSVETIQKQYTHCIYATSDLIRGSKVGLTV